VPGDDPGRASPGLPARSVVIAAVTCAAVIICVLQPRRPARLFRDNRDAPKPHTPGRVRRGVIGFRGRQPTRQHNAKSRPESRHGSSHDGPSSGGEAARPLCRKMGDLRKAGP